MGHIRITAINPPWADHAKWGLSGFHGTNLHRGRVGAQQGAGIKIEGIMHSPGGMVARNVESFEVMVVVFNFRALLYGVAGAGKEVFDTLESSGNRVQSTKILTATR